MGKVGKDGFTLVMKTMVVNSRVYCICGSRGVVVLDTDPVLQRINRDALHQRLICWKLAIVMVGEMRHK